MINFVRHKNFSVDINNDDDDDDDEPWLWSFSFMKQHSQSLSTGYRIYINGEHINGDI